MILLPACQSRTVFHSHCSINANGWDKEDTLHFVVPIKNDTAIPLHLTVEIRNTDNYPYTNLYLTVNGDTIECTLANSKGKWTGKGITIYQNQFSSNMTMHASRPDTLPVNICHIMNDQQLKGIQNIGIRLER